MTTTGHAARTGAERQIPGIGDAGADCLFANAGTDFPPAIEALATPDPDRIPRTITAPHETAAVGMAHGHHLLSVRPRAVMVHVNVGLANAAVGVINAASDNVPMRVTSGRPQITERQRKGARVTPIQYGQEISDRASIVRDVAKRTCGMRYPDQGAALAHPAVAIARTAPEGSVYLGLPREPLAEEVPASAPKDATPVPTPTAAAPDPVAVDRAAEWLARAERPPILCQRGDVGGRLSGHLSRLATRTDSAVCEPFPVRYVLPSDDPALAGFAAAGPIREADLILVVDSDVPWIQASQRPGEGTRVVYVAPDPLVARMPARGCRADLCAAADPCGAATALLDALGLGGSGPPRTAPAATACRAGAAATAKSGAAAPMTAKWMSRCMSGIMDDTAVAFTELGLLPGCMKLAGPNRLFLNPHSGGLGWAMSAALGAQPADRTRLVVACMGDGPYMLTNPVACQQIAAALELPILTIVKNNAMWNAVRRSVVMGYSGGAAARANEMPLTSLSPSPDFATVARASRAHAERIEHGRELPAALARAVEIIRAERQVLLDLQAIVSDEHR